MKKISITSVFFVLVLSMFVVLSTNIFANANTPLNLTVVSPTSETPVVNENFLGQFGGNLEIDLSTLTVGQENNEVAFSIHNGKMITNMNPSFIISGSTNVVVVIKEIGTEVSAYVDSNGRFLSVKYGVDNEFTPVDLTKPGYEFSGWQADSNNDDDNKLFVATYQRTSEELAVSLNIVGGSPDILEPEYNQVVTLTPTTEVDFAYWADEDGQVVSTDKNYKFSAIPQNGNANIHLEAVYQVDYVEIPSIYLNNVTGIRSEHQSFMGYINKSNGYTVVEFGFLASNTGTVLTLEDNPNITVIPSKSISNNNEFLRSFKNDVFNTFRAYAILLDDIDQEVIVYSENNFFYTLEKYETGFEDISKNAYPSETKVTSGKGWNLDNAVVGTSLDDKKNDNRSIRIAQNGNIELLDGITGLKKITFNYAQWRDKVGSTITVEVKINEGSWENIATITDIQFSLLNFSIDLDYNTLLANSSDTFLVRISNGNIERVNVDDVKLEYWTFKKI